MDPPFAGAGALLLLALTDSLSFGTLLVPIWLLMTPGRFHLRRVLVYLVAVSIAYFGIGIVLIAGGRVLIENASNQLNSDLARVAQLVVGMVLLILSFALDTKAARARAATHSQRDGRMRHWRNRAMAAESTGLVLVALAFTAVLVEVASMFPYIAATGIIASETSGPYAALLPLSAYCMVMVAPALALSALRVTAHSFVQPLLEQLDGWLTQNARSMTLWIVGIAGFLLAANAIDALGWIPG